MRFSACWIAKNEEKTLARSIESLTDAVDELVVVDTGSEDNTIGIAESYGAKIGRFEWTGDFSAARNYALSLCGGETVIFLDADEWFVPALSLSDREGIESLFASNPEADAIQLRIHNLNDHGAVSTISSVNRIIRKKPGLSYKKRIHEELTREGGALPVLIISDNWKLHHSGYAGDVFTEKMRRNIELLEDAAEHAADPLERHLQHLYLVREYIQIDKKEDSLKHLKIVLSKPELINRLYADYNQGIVPLIYGLLTAAATLREHISRREIRRKIIEPFKKHLKTYPGAATIDLYYSTLFDLKEDVLLDKAGPAFEASRKMPPSPISNYLEYESFISYYAAEAAFKRGKIPEAFDYAINSLKKTGSNTIFALRVLLRCLRGQPPEEIILFLNSQFGPEKLDYLTSSTRLDGFGTVHTYYLDKKINAGIATKGEYLYLLLLCGKHEESVKAALEFYNENNASIIKQHLFLTAVCSGREEFYRGNAELLADYANILEAYFSKTAPESLSSFDLSVLVENFSLIAIASGIETAECLEPVYQSRSLLFHQVKTKYLVDNGLYKLALEQTTTNPQDPLIEIFTIESLIMTDNIDPAVERINLALAQDRVNGNLLSYLLAAADRCAEDPVKNRAKTLYDSYMPLYDKLIDLLDIVRTGYVFDDNDRKKQNAFKSLTTAQLNRRFALEAAQPLIGGLPELCEKAGAIYEERNLFAAAADCYISAVAQGYNAEENKIKLEKLLRKIGNYKISVK